MKPDLITLLLASGAKASDTDEARRTALHIFAREYCRPEHISSKMCYQLLIGYSRNPTAL